MQFDYSNDIRPRRLGGMFLDNPPTDRAPTKSSVNYSENPNGTYTPPSLSELVVGKESTASRIGGSVMQGLMPMIMGIVGGMGHQAGESGRAGFFRGYSQGMQQYNTLQEKKSAEKIALDAKLAGNKDLMRAYSVALSKNPKDEADFLQKVGSEYGLSGMFKDQPTYTGLAYAGTVSPGSDYDKAAKRIEEQKAREAAIRNNLQDYSTQTEIKYYDAKGNVLTPEQIEAGEVPVIKKTETMRQKTKASSPSVAGEVVRDPKTGKLTIK